MDQRRIKRGSTWINVDQASSACPSARPSACRPWLMRQTHGSCVRRPTHVACVRRPTHVACVRLMRQAHGSCVPLTWHASGSCVRLMRPASGVPLTWHASGVRLHVACVRRQTPRALIQPPIQPIQPPIQPIQPPPVAGHDDNKRRHLPHATAPRFAPIALYGMG